MISKNGVRVRTGDLMAEVSGGGMWQGREFSSICLFEVPKVRDGHGYHYNNDGKRSLFAWASPTSSYTLDVTKLPDGFVFAFKHGLCHIDVDVCFMGSDIHEAIAHSDWKNRAITPEDVASLKAASNIQISSFMDIAERWDTIFCTKWVHHQIVEQVLQLVSYKGTTVINGEVGMARMQDELTFLSIYEVLVDWKKKEVLVEKCRELDAERLTKTLK